MLGCGFLQSCGARHDEPSASRKFHQDSSKCVECKLGIQDWNARLECKIGKQDWNAKVECMIGMQRVVQDARQPLPLAVQLAVHPCRASRRKPREARGGFAAAPRGMPRTAVWTFSDTSVYFLSCQPVQTCQDPASEDKKRKAITTRASACDQYFDLQDL